MPSNIVNATVASEFLRRIKNTSRDINEKNIEATLSLYCKELKLGGFGEQWIEEALRSAAVGYERILKGELEGKGRINRPESHGKTKRRVEKLVGKTNWFKEPKEKEEQGKTQGRKEAKEGKKKGKMTKKAKIESVLFVPYTKNSELKKMVQQAEDSLMKNRSHGRVIVMERVGQSIQNVLCNNKHWKNQECGREGCGPCMSKPGS